MTKDERIAELEDDLAYEKDRTADLAREIWALEAKVAEMHRTGHTSMDEATHVRVEISRSGKVWRCSGDVSAFIRPSEDGYLDALDGLTHDVGRACVIGFAQEVHRGE